MSSPTGSAFRMSGLFELLLLAAAFAVAHTQSPLFFSNQNQYLLHGFAAGGSGELHADWLANTTDPTPLFSLGIQYAYRLFGGWSLQPLYFLLLMGYFLSVWWLITGLSPNPPSRRARFAFSALFLAAHAAIFRWLSVKLTGVDYPFYLQSGVAGQYVLGPGLQPSSFGVLLIAALAAFAHRRPYLAVVLQSAACLVHSTYLLPAALLTAGEMVVLSWEGKTKTALGMGIAALLGVLPTVGYTLLYFSPTSPDIFAESQRVLAFVRIPHHTRIDRWLDGVAAFQIVWIALGIGLTWRTRLFPVLAFAATLALVLSVAQWFSGEATFALFFPWRVSVVLMPVATAMFAWKAATFLPPSTALRGIFYAAIFGISVLGGMAVTAWGLGYSENAAERETIAFVRKDVQPGDVYLLPVRFPAVGTGPRGSVSTSFTPPPRPKPGSNLIPVDLQRFRMLTGAPIFVDFKAVPYKDTEVLEWQRRMEQCQKWYENWERATPQELKNEGITHVLTPRDKPANVPWLEPVHKDEAYIVYRFR